MRSWSKRLGNNFPANLVREFQRNENSRLPYAKFSYTFSENEVLLAALDLSNLKAFIVQQHRESAEIQDKASGIYNHSTVVTPATRIVGMTDKKIAGVWSEGSE